MRRPWGCKAKISEDGSHYILNGEKMWVTNGSSANIYVLFAKDVDHPEFGEKKHGGTTAFIVEKAFEGFSVGKKEDKLGIRSSDTCSLILKDCRVPVENVLKGVGEGFPIAMNALDNSRIGIAAQALGIAQGSFEAALNYAHERVAFGKPIAHHQSVGNYLADMATRTEAARLMVYKASSRSSSTMRKVRRGTQWMPVWQNSSQATLQCGFRKEQCKYWGVWVYYGLPS